MTTFKLPQTSNSFRRQRRQILRAAAAAPLFALPKIALAEFESPGTRLARSGSRELSFLHAHTGEKVRAVYWENGSYLTDALDEINYLLRDFRSEEVFPIDRQVLDLAHGMQAVVGNNNAFTVFSAFRSPETNEKLRQSSSGVAKKSYHMQGKALDIRLDGISASELHRIAVSLSVGGAGLYQSSGFVHIDVGPVRQW